VTGHGDRELDLRLTCVTGVRTVAGSVIAGQTSVIVGALGFRSHRQMLRRAGGGVCDWDRSTQALRAGRCVVSLMGDL